MESNFALLSIEEIKDGKNAHLLEKDLNDLLDQYKRTFLGILRSVNCLRKGGWRTLGDLVQDQSWIKGRRRESDDHMRGFGPKSYNTLWHVLVHIGFAREGWDTSETSEWKFWTEEQIGEETAVINPEIQRLEEELERMNTELERLKALRKVIYDIQGGREMRGSHVPSFVEHMMSKYPRGG